MSKILFLKNECLPKTLVKNIEFQPNYISMEIITVNENDGSNYVILSVDYNNSILYHYKFEYNYAFKIDLLIQELIDFDTNKYYYNMPIEDFRKYIIRLCNKFKNDDDILLTDTFKYN